MIFLLFTYLGPGMIKTFLTLRTGNAWVHVWAYHAFAHTLIDTPTSSRSSRSGDAGTDPDHLAIDFKEGMFAMSPTSAIPARIAWAVDQLAVGETDRILEIGGGRGVAAAVICARLARGSYLGIDRSETAVRASGVRNWEHVERGTARFEQQALQDVDPTQLPRFDKVFAINVNLFWTRPAQGELALVRQLLSDDGQLDLFYDSPTPAGTAYSRLTRRTSGRSRLRIYVRYRHPRKTTGDRSVLPTALNSSSKPPPTHKRINRNYAQEGNP